jgi:uncharacterized protein (TIGR02265 family)
VSRPIRHSSAYTSCPPDFGPPDYRSPIDLAEHLARVPPHATGKGMFLGKLFDELDERGIARPTQERFLPFHDYPLTRCLELNLQVARLLHPRVPDREALRRVAWRSFTTFASSIVGRVVFGAVGRNPIDVLSLATRALPMTTNVGDYTLESIDHQHAILHVHEGYLFVEPFGAGMVEGVFSACEHDGEVLVKRTSPTSCSFFIGLH